MLVKSIAFLEKEENTANKTYHNASQLLDKLQDISLIALSRNGELLRATSPALHTMKKASQKLENLMLPNASIPSMLAHEFQGKNGQTHLSLNITVYDLQAEMQIVPLDVSGTSLILAKLDQLKPLEKNSPSRKDVHSKNIIAEKQEPVDPEPKKDTGIFRKERENEKESAQNIRLRQYLEPRKEDEDDEIDIRQQSKMINAKIGNIFPFTGAPVRICDKKIITDMKEKHALREIARALGAKIEGEQPPEEQAFEREPGLNVADELKTKVTDNDPDSASHNEVFTLLDKISNGILVYRDNQPVYANRSFLSMFGCPDFADLRYGISIPDLLEKIAKSAQNTAPSEPNTHKNRQAQSWHFNNTAQLQFIQWGGKRAMLLNVSKNALATPLLNHLDQVNQVSILPSLAKKQTDPGKKNAKDIAAKKSQEHESILSVATDGILILDKNGYILSVNTQAGKLLGGQPNDHLGQKVISLFSSDAHAFVTDYFRTTPAQCSTDGQYRTKVRHTRIKDRLLQFRFGQIMDDQETRHCLILYETDSSEEKHETELIEARQTAETANAQKSTFLANVSHEIRTPLNSIIGFSEIIIQEKFSGIENERYRTYIRDIHTSGNHLLCLVNDLLDLSKIEAGKLKLDMRDIDINEIARHSLDLLQPDASRCRIILRQDLAQNLPYIMADKRSLHQILLNLLSNAVKFTEPGGQVLISTNVNEENEISIRVRDTGVGMTRQELNLALEAFCQVHTPNVEHKIFGTGLGLTLTKALAEANKAKFKLSSTPQQGTLAEVIFPGNHFIAR